MKILKERTEMAIVMNFGKYPVLELNLDNNPYPEHEFAQGGTVRVAWDSTDPRYDGMNSVCKLVLEKGEYSLMQGGVALKASYTLDDFMKNMKTANTPLVHKDQIVAVAHYSRDTNKYFIRMMKVSSRIDTNCMTVETLLDLTKEDKAEVELYIWKTRKARGNNLGNRENNKS